MGSEEADCYFELNRLSPGKGLPRARVKAVWDRFDAIETRQFVEQGDGLNLENGMREAFCLGGVGSVKSEPVNGIFGSLIGDEHGLQVSHVRALWRVPDHEANDVGVYCQMNAVAGLQEPADRDTRATEGGDIGRDHVFDFHAL